MNQKEIDQLIETYKDYAGSERFIYACFKCFKSRKPDFAKKFINGVFRNNSIQDCYHTTFKKLSAHWNNVAYEKLLQGDYESYMYTAHTVANYRIIAHFLEVNIYNLISNE